MRQIPAGSSPMVLLVGLDRIHPIDPVAGMNVTAVTSAIQSSSR
jgi:hypothetical protein